MKNQTTKMHKHILRAARPSLKDRARIRTASGGCETKLFIESERGLLPLLQRNDGGEGWGEVPS